MKNTYLFPKMLVSDLQIGSQPSRAEMDALRIRSASSELVRVDAEQSDRVMGLNFDNIESEQLVGIAEDMLYRPQPFQIWLMCSKNIAEGVKKFEELLGWDNGMFSMSRDRVDVNAEAQSRGVGPISFSVSFMALWFSSGLPESGTLVVNLREGYEKLGRLLEDRFDFKVQYGQSWVGLSIIGDNICQMPLKTSNPVLESLLHPGYSHPDISGHSEVVGVARKLIRDNLSNPEYSLGDLASALCMSPRSLQRKLSAEKSSFSALREQQRRDFIRESFASGLRREQLKDLLGYQDVGAIYKLLRKSSA